MAGLGWTQDEIDAVSPERRERLLWRLHADRLVAIRDRISSRPAFDEAAAQARSSEVMQLDMLLFPGSIPAIPARADVPHGKSPPA